MEQVKCRGTTRLIAYIDIIFSLTVLAFAVSVTTTPFWSPETSHGHYAASLICGSLVALFWLLSVRIAFMLLEATSLEIDPVTALSTARIWIYANIPMTFICGFGWFGLDILLYLLICIPIRAVLIIFVWNYSKELVPPTSLNMYGAVDKFESEHRIEENRDKLMEIDALPPDQRQEELQNYFQPPPSPPPPPRNSMTGIGAMNNTMWTR